MSGERKIMIITSRFRNDCIHAGDIVLYTTNAAHRCGSQMQLTFATQQCSTLMRHTNTNHRNTAHKCSFIVIILLFLLLLIIIIRVKMYHRRPRLHRRIQASRGLVAACTHASHHILILLLFLLLLLNVYLCYVPGLGLHTELGCIFPLRRKVHLIARDSRASCTLMQQ